MTDLEIMNTALGRLGQSPIVSFGQNIGTGLLSIQNYNQERDALLRKIPWNFARRWTTLAMLQTAPLALDIAPNSAAPGSIQMTAAFQLPLDCLRVYRFSPRDAHWRIIGRQVYTDAIPAVNLGILLGLQPLSSDGSDNQPPTPSNVSSAQNLGIEYISRITDTTQFDDMFTETFIWKLCKDLAFGVTGLREVFVMAEQEYVKSLNDASAVNGMENWPDEYWNTTLTDVRYGYVGTSINNG